MEQTGASAVDILGTLKKLQDQSRVLYTDYLSLMGLVPLYEHLALAGQKEELERRITSREESGHYFRQLLSEVRESYGVDLAKQLNELFGKQTDQFKETMNSLIDMYKKNSSVTKDSRSDLAKQFSEVLNKQGEQFKKLFEKYIEQSRKDSSETKEEQRVEAVNQINALISQQAEQLRKMMDDFIDSYKKDFSEAREAYRMEMAKQFNDLMDKQSEQVQKLIDSFAERQPEQVATL
jgi:methyl-accepting chemotaxis protein